MSFLRDFQPVLDQTLDLTVFLVDTCFVPAI